MQYNIKNKILLHCLDEYVEGHTLAKKALIALLQRIKVRCHQKYVKEMNEENIVDPMKLLLIGGSGTGKTHLITTLEKMEHFPLVKVDAAQFNVTAGSGGMKIKHLQDLINKKAIEYHYAFPYTYKSPDHALDSVVVFVDEVDKLGGGDKVLEWNQNVQSEFLTLFDNKDVYKGVSFIFAGAFSDITKYKELGNTIGFNGFSQIKDTRLLDDMLVATGLLPELVGRFSNIIELDVFTVDDYINIMKKRIIPKKLLDLSALGIEAESISDDDIRIIAEKAVKSSQGVRFIKRLIDNAYIELEYDSNIILD